MRDDRQWHRAHPDLWTYRVPLKLFGSDIGRRGTVVRYADRRWAFVGPVPLDPEAHRSLAEAGRVDALIVVTAFHNAFVEDACAAFPEARVYAARGAKTKRLPQERLRSLGELPDDLTGVLVPYPLKYRMGNEVLFFHRASGSLIAGDFCVHFPDDPPDRRERLLRRLLGWVPGPRMPTLLKLLLDRRAASKTFESIVEQRPRRIVVAHGESVEERDIEPAIEALRRGLA